MYIYIYYTYIYIYMYINLVPKKDKVSKSSHVKGRMLMSTFMNLHDACCLVGAGGSLGGFKYPLVNVYIAIEHAHL